MFSETACTVDGRSLRDGKKNNYPSLWVCVASLSVHLQRPEGKPAGAQCSTGQRTSRPWEKVGVMGQRGDGICRVEYRGEGSFQVTGEGS